MSAKCASSRMNFSRLLAVIGRNVTSRVAYYGELLARRHINDDLARRPVNWRRRILINGIAL